MTFDSPIIPFDVLPPSPYDVSKIAPLETKFGAAETATTNGIFFSFIPQPGAKQYDRYPMMGNLFLAAFYLCFHPLFCIVSFNNKRKKSKCPWIGIYEYARKIAWTDVE